MAETFPTGNTAPAASVAAPAQQVAPSEWAVHVLSSQFVEGRLDGGRFDGG
jgi:hypothetical protein